MNFAILYSSSPAGEEAWEVRYFLTSFPKPFLLEEKGGTVLPNTFGLAF